MMRLSIASLLLALVLPCTAQDSLSYPKPKITAFEFLIGSNSSTLRGAADGVGSYAGGGNWYYITTAKNKIAFTAGVGLTHNISKHFTVQGRLLWEQKGINQKTDSVTISSTGTVTNSISWSTNESRNDYITISLMPQFLAGRSAYFNIGAGIYSSILVESIVIDKFYYLHNTQQSFSYTGNFEKYDFGFSINVGYTYPVGKGLGLTIQFISNYGIQQISALRKSNPDSRTLYNSSNSLMLGVRINNKKSKLKILH